ncbi:hypothetical protein SD70_29875 [Gordoniibacillus kamchatkensis]|uniref:Anti-sigma-W factor RsiW n=1 Tax=Gordoniibacillus kamchatkensis TaxID=1590651 RepID=A0ABR5AAB6_9BACL|nr:zf-HC2 domain-containing protein [Paenibacillus sp. VKM B-2647]KIL37922.1 hypothetical protein SD70_29875 [Paenibacillus sp. VKM B-2647]
MTCHEQVELMQRYLDHDLSDTEERELKEHLVQCAECSGLFDRLQRLDSELSQLPKVTPAYSLVDAIMPQLAELDRCRGRLRKRRPKNRPQPLLHAASLGHAGFSPLGSWLAALP